MLLADPQTSGGLLLCVPRSKRTEFEQRMVNSNASYWIIGEVVEGNVIDVQRESGQDST